MTCSTAHASHAKWIFSSAFIVLISVISQMHTYNLVFFIAFRVPFGKTVLFFGHHLLSKVTDEVQVCSGGNLVVLR